MSFKKYLNVDPNTKVALLQTLNNKKQGHFQEFQRVIGMTGNEVDGII
jgi:hypothetical protein